MTNQDLFNQSKKTIINPTGTIKYIRDLGLSLRMTKTSEVIDHMVNDYNNSKDPSLKHNGHPADFALYINLIVNY